MLVVVVIMATWAVIALIYLRILDTAGNAWVALTGPEPADDLLNDPADDLRAQLEELTESADTSGPEDSITHEPMDWVVRPRQLPTDYSPSDHTSSSDCDGELTAEGSIPHARGCSISRPFSTTTTGGEPNNEARVVPLYPEVPVDRSHRVRRARHR
jgi:hypothetical protein